jgi:hypothetical protein
MGKNNRKKQYRDTDFNENNGEWFVKKRKERDNYYSDEYDKDDNDYEDFSDEEYRD